MKAYKPGSWWVYENTSGLRDSVYLTDHRGSMEIIDERASSCFGLPETELTLESAYLDTTGRVYVTYRGNRPEVGALVIMASESYGGRTLLEFGFAPGYDYGNSYVIDTTIASVPYTDVLRVDQDPSVPGGVLEVIFMAKNIGIVSYVTQTDTFTLTAYHIP